MQAIVATAYGGPEVLEAREVPLPEPTADQMLVAVAACGVCGHDRHARRGDFPLSKPPFVMGHEIAGTVRKVGPLVSGFAEGDRVALIQRISCGTCVSCKAGRENLCTIGPGFYGEALSGGYGDYVVASPRNAVRVPDGIPFDVAAVCGCALGTGFHALRRGGFSIGDVVVITAAGGGVGLNAVKVAALMGLVVVAVTSSAGKIDALRRAGASEVVVAPTHEFHDQVRKITGGVGANGVIEIAGNPTFRSSMRSLRAAGRLVLVGNLSPGPVPLNPAVSILKEIELIGSGHARTADLACVLNLVATGRLTPEIAGHLHRSEAIEAHRRIEAGVPAGRLVLLNS